MPNIYNSIYAGSYDANEYTFGVEGIQVNYIKKLMFRQRFGSVAFDNYKEVFVFNDQLNFLSSVNYKGITEDCQFYFCRNSVFYLMSISGFYTNKHELLKMNIESRELTLFDSFECHSVFSRTIGSKGIGTLSKKFGLQLFCYDTEKLLWKMPTNNIASVVSNMKQLVSTNFSYSEKTCLDFNTGKHLWTIAAGKFDGLNDLKTLGPNILIDNSLISVSWVLDVPPDPVGYPSEWFSIDINSQELQWRRTLPFQLTQTIYADKCYHYLYRDVDLGTYYYSSVDFTTGKDVITIDITEEIIKNRPERRQPFYNDSWYRAMTVSENYIYFGIGVRFVRMSRLTYEIEVLYEGKSVFDNSEFAFGRLFVTEMIGGTVMFSEKGAPETDLDRFFMEIPMKTTN